MLCDLIIEAIGQDKWSDKAPGVDAIAHPCTDNLGPTSPIGSTDRNKVVLEILFIEVRCKKGSYPRGAKEEDDVEQAVVVLGGVSFVVAGVLGRAFILIITVGLIQSGSGK